MSFSERVIEMRDQAGEPVVTVRSVSVKTGRPIEQR